jgi:hypothetical protein
MDAILDVWGEVSMGADTSPTSLIVILWIYTAVPIIALNTKEFARWTGSSSCDTGQVLWRVRTSLGIVRLTQPRRNSSGDVGVSCGSSGKNRYVGVSCGSSGKNRYVGTSCGSSGKNRYVGVPHRCLSILEGIEHLCFMFESYNNHKNHSFTYFI